MPPVGSLQTDLASSIRAQVALARDRPADALRILEETPRIVFVEKAWASSFHAQPLERYVRAELLSAAGRDEEALGWYETVAGIEGWMGVHDAVYRAPSLFRTAEIYARLGRHELAIERYTQFIDLWENCDPMLQPMVEEAERKLGELQRASSSW